jgi:hypothetical protein
MSLTAALSNALLEVYLLFYPQDEKSDYPVAIWDTMGWYGCQWYCMGKSKIHRVIHRLLRATKMAQIKCLLVKESKEHYS